jgi:3-oxoacyl-[acyl-carrier-protein] synthase-3
MPDDPRYAGDDLIHADGPPAAVQSVLRRLFGVWAEFEARLTRVPIIDKLNRGKFRMEDYHLILLNHRQQVIDGGRWIAQAAASITDDFAPLRTAFLEHAATEHRDYRMLEEDYIRVGGTREAIQAYEKNIGSEALSAWMFHRARQPDPFDLLGAMYIIEGLGRRFAADFAAMIQTQLGLPEDHLQFYRYHGKADEAHLDELVDTLGSGVLDLPDMADAIVKTARVTGRLYLLQLEEIGNH